MIDDKLISIKDFRVKPGKKVRLKDYDTKYTGKLLTKKEAESLLELSKEKLAEIQDKLYAHNRYRILIIFQAMDAAGKDGAVKHIMSGFNPLGVKVHSFKAPTSHELDHDYFWRHYVTMPARGEIAIHNRSHYENVLVTRVHPEYILGEHLPTIKKKGDVDDEFWQDRFKQIVRFEKNLVENGMVILKFFLNVSKKEQKKRFLERIDDPSKNWKFSLSDLKERGYWDDYQKAYEDVFTETSKDNAPWYIIPADDKWYTRVAIASVIYRTLAELDIHYPQIDEDQRAALLKARAQLTDEEQEAAPKKPKK